MSKSNLLFTLLFSLLISACSPHPASGQWQNIAIGDNHIAMLEVMFDGKAEMYTANKERVLRRCFWAGQDSKSISLTCVDPDDTDADIQYQLQVSDNQAQLRQADQIIASFRKP